jgi:hypothetical protein
LASLASKSLKTGVKKNASHRGNTKMSDFLLVYRSNKSNMQNTEEVQENTRRERNFLKDRLAVQQQHVNVAHNLNTCHRDELQKDCQALTETELRANTSFQQTSDMEKEQMRRQLRTTVLKAEILEKELYMILKYEAYRMRRIREIVIRENMLCVALTDYLNDDSSNESELECGDGDADDGNAPAEE